MQTGLSLTSFVDMMLSSASSSKKKLWDTKPEFCLQKIHFKCMCARPPVVVITNLDDLHRFPVQHRFVIHVDSRSCSVLGGGRPEEMARNCPSSTGERFWSERCDNVKSLNLFSLYACTWLKLSDTVPAVDSTWLSIMHDASRELRTHTQISKVHGAVSLRSGRSGG